MGCCCPRGPGAAGSTCISRGGRAVGCTTGVDPVHERLRSRGDADEVRVVLVQLGVVQPQRRARVPASAAVSVAVCPPLLLRWWRWRWQRRALWWS